MSFISDYLKIFFNFMHDTVIVGSGISNPNISYGLAIILFTIIVRVLLLPLNIRQMHSQVKMQEVQPELKKLQEKHKGDPQKSQQEMMKLYKEKGVNPMGGCFPLLIQLPILWALFYVFRNIHPVDPVTGQNITVSFLWIHDLFKVDQLKILPILAGGTQYISALLMPKPADSAQAKQTSTMNIAMSFMMVFMAWNFNAGLVLYWVTQNVIQMGQNLLIKKVLVKKVD